VRAVSAPECSRSKLLSKLAFVDFDRGTQPSAPGVNVHPLQFW
jgi:hypothetical protein